MTFERTFDYELVRRIIAHPKIYRWMQSDGAVPAEEYRPPQMPEIWYVLVKEGQELLGLFILLPQTTVCVQAHMCLLPIGRNEKAREVYRCGFDWVWQNTTAEKVIGFTPSYNFAAVRVAEEAGMHRCGILTNSLKKFGRLHDQIIFAIGRPHHG